MSSQTPLLGALVEHECPRCGREVELPLGELCSECRSGIERRARLISRWVALTTTVILIVYLYLRMPNDLTARWVGVSAAIAWYVIVGLVTKRILREALK